MQRKTVTLTVIVNLDMVPGTMHTPESAQETVQSILNQAIEHYKPVVNLPEEKCHSITTVPERTHNDLIMDTIDPDFVESFERDL